jgi:hypothetical protein
MYNITAQMPTSYPQHSSFDNTAVLMSCPQHNSFGTTAVPTSYPQHGSFGTTAVLTSCPQHNSFGTTAVPTSDPQHSSFDNTAVLTSCPQHNSFGTTAVPTCCPQHNNFGTTAVLTSDPQLNSISAAGMMGSGPGIAPWAFPGPAQQLAGAPVQSFEQPQYTPDPWDRFMSQSSTQESMQTPPDSFDLAGVDCADLNLDDVNWDEMFPGV